MQLIEAGADGFVAVIHGLLDRQQPLDHRHQRHRPDPDQRVQLQQRNKAEQNLDDLHDAQLSVVINVADGINTTLGLHAQLIEGVGMLGLLGIKLGLMTSNPNIFKPIAFAIGSAVEQQRRKGTQHTQKAPEATAPTTTRSRGVDAPHLRRQQTSIHPVGPVKFRRDGTNTCLDAGDVGKRNARNSCDLARDCLQAFFDLRITHEK